MPVRMPRPMTIAAAFPYQPVKERGTLRSFVLALFMHLLLGIVLYYGVHWQSSTPVGSEAELWDEIPATTAPPPAPPAPPEPVVQPRPVPPAPEVKSKVEEDADIALERQKRRAAEQAAREEVARKDAARKEAERKEAERKEAERQEAQRKDDARKKAAQQEQQHREQAERERKEADAKARAKADAEAKADAQAKAKAEADARAKADAKAEAKAKAEADAKAKAEAQAKAKADADARARREAAANAQRKGELARLQAMAGGGAGGQGGGGVGSAAGAGAGGGGKASSGYADRVRRKVKPNIVFTEDAPGNPTAVVSVQLAPDGSLMSARLSKPSGNSAWDNAVLRAVERSDPLPRDENGKAPASFTITFRPKD
ncbi:cell envelope integrity protein TolA [Cupriavidus yeoncheonensis]|nr:cell envelope integrity protein TolA [Cupriavidus yeoncheonensis]